MNSADEAVLYRFQRLHALALFRPVCFFLALFAESSSLTSRSMSIAIDADYGASTRSHIFSSGCEAILKSSTRRPIAMISTAVRPPLRSSAA
jgi:hypothetical protein